MRRLENVTNDINTKMENQFGYIKMRDLNKLGKNVVNFLSDMSLNCSDVNRSAKPSAVNRAGPGRGKLKF